MHINYYIINTCCDCECDVFQRIINFLSSHSPTNLRVNVFIISKSNL